jgi:hypothetical protein
MDDLTKLWFQRAVVAASETTKTKLREDNAYAQAFLKGFKAAAVTQEISEQICKTTYGINTICLGTCLVVLACIIILTVPIFRRRVAAAFQQWRLSRVQRRRRQVMQARRAEELEERKVRAERRRRIARQRELIARQEGWMVAETGRVLDKAKKMRQKRITEFLERSRSESNMEIRRPKLWSELLQQSERGDVDMDIVKKVESDGAFAVINMPNHIFRY